MSSTRFGLVGMQKVIGASERLRRETDRSSDYSDRRLVAAGTELTARYGEGNYSASQLLRYVDKCC